ncbi:RluA family pseudouridine synthase [Caenispirillum salinarum]|uniref:RluA family pseudouridine synthase n=1 Tax=Caenispirillum salinarum TaxID=859058 RepID=UPI00384C9483
MIQQPTDPATVEDDDDALPPDLEAEPGPGALHTAEAGPEAAGLRLDKWLAEALGDPGLTRSRLKQLIDEGRVTLDGRTLTAADASRKIKAGQTAAVAVPPPDPAVPEPQDIPLAVVFEDAHLIVVDKPAGMVVHPAAGNADGTLVNALLHHCGASLSGIGGVRRPGIVHRIDKDTSGLLVAAKSDAAHQGLAALFARHDIERVYTAVVWGVPVPRKGTITGNIARSTANRQKMAVVKSGGKPAVTHYQVTAPLAGGTALVTCRLETGRTHQIRVHMATQGHPLVGDPVYGRSRNVGRRGLSEAQAAALKGFGRQALHAGVLGFVHPVTGEALRFESALPEDMADLVDALRP